MPQPTSIEAGEYSRWDAEDDELQPCVAGEVGAGETGGTALDPVSFVAGDEADGGRLDKWLARRMPSYSRGRIQRWIGDGHVRIDGRVGATRDPVWKGANVRVAIQSSDEENAFLPEDIALDIVHEDDALLVLNKRAGLVVHPASGNWSGTVLNGLLHHAPSLAAVPRAGIVHRLDKDTSGLMVVAKTVVAQTDLVRQLQARSVGRTYVAIVHGAAPKSGRIAWPIGRDPRDRTRMTAFKPQPTAHPAYLEGRSGAKPAATRFETLASIELVRGDSVSLIVCRLETGRTHQIRVHLQALGHPLVGDATYGGRRGQLAFDRQALHAWHLRLVHPSTKRPMAWRADVPADLHELASRAGFDIDRLLTQDLVDRGDD